MQGYTIDLSLHFSKAVKLCEDKLSAMYQCFSDWVTFFLTVGHSEPLIPIIRARSIAKADATTDSHLLLGERSSIMHVEGSFKAMQLTIWPMTWLERKVCWKIAATNPMLRKPS